MMLGVRVSSSICYIKVTSQQAWRQCMHRNPKTGVENKPLSEGNWMAIMSAYIQISSMFSSENAVCRHIAPTCK